MGLRKQHASDKRFALVKLTSLETNERVHGYGGRRIKKLLEVLLALGSSSCMHWTNVQDDAVERGGNDWVLRTTKSPPSQHMRLALAL